MFWLLMKLLCCALLGNFEAVNCTSDFNLTEYLDPHEISDLFGSEEVPAHRLVELSFPDFRDKQRANETIEINIQLKTRQINLRLKPTDGCLIAKYTPVWLASSDIIDDKVNYELLPTAIAKIGEFKMYHDLSNDAAITVFYNEEGGNAAYGIISRNLAIKALPYHDEDTRLSKNKRYHVIYRIQTKSETQKSNMATKIRMWRLEEDAPRPTPKIVYPEILIISDYSMKTDKPLEDVLKYIISYWNTIDLAYSRIKIPKVRLNIAGIVQAGDIKALKYIKADYNRRQIYEIKTTVPSIPDKFAEDFPVLETANFFDIVMVMTTLDLCINAETRRKCDGLHGMVTAANDLCPRTLELGVTKYSPGTGIFTCDESFYGGQVAVHQLGYLLGARSERKEQDVKCRASLGYAMAPIINNPDRKNGLKFSVCSLKKFRGNFERMDNTCADNEPVWFLRTRPLTPQDVERFAEDQEIKRKNIDFIQQCKILDMEELTRKVCRAIRYESLMIKIKFCSTHGNHFKSCQIGCCINRG